MIYFISDLHFGHKNILKYDNRPFFTITEHDNTIIQNWNDTVNDKDTVYILGDVSWRGKNETLELLKQLNGTKILVAGNHDGVIIKNKELSKQFEDIISYKEIRICDKKLCLCHYPIPFFNGRLKGDYHFYGHVHNSTIEYKYLNTLINEMKKNGEHTNMYNVGCMMPYMEYKPKTFNEIISIKEGR